ncbi:hypothetical protein QBC42DRAFT_348297 [Cladorrhinum samala]|uniref:Uncharacterized protein n=1 Tax=Cladorrhinum samala TaxID=585594 RepID=A0AAV9HLZ4_9PEZI|nr:hypothetical protein QBC42DRAFT_348297 [Cladorrhinum samala]
MAHRPLTKARQASQFLVSRLFAAPLATPARPLIKREGDQPFWLSGLAGSAKCSSVKNPTREATSANHPFRRSGKGSVDKTRAKLATLVLTCSCVYILIVSGFPVSLIESCPEFASFLGESKLGMGHVPTEVNNLGSHAEVRMPPNKPESACKG